MECLWLLTVVLVPLAFVTRGDLSSAASIAYLEVPKIALLRTLVALMAILWLIEWGIQSRISLPVLSKPKPLRLNGQHLLAAPGNWLRGHPERWLNLAVVFFLATTVLSTVLSASFEVSMWGDVPGEDGYGTYTVISYVLLFAVVATHLKTPTQFWRLLGAVATMGVLVSLFAVLEHFGHAPWDLKFPTNISRATSTMGNPILAASVILMTLSISLTLAVVSLR